ncbi:hypothetical protein MTR_3g105030 [Medicago truncatula]|uniref:Uncharacterized protein n=1 Tax=Medicago truncatula TaxID=3880 RepID=G7J8E9_MEDTR|nr:hypothetical protein MTR_3g105030 [Medicago truncatula]
MKRYFITFIDDYLNYTSVYIIRNKSDTPDNFKVFFKEDPTGPHEALSSLNVYLWQEAIKDEMDSLESNKT